MSDNKPNNRQKTSRYNTLLIYLILICAFMVSLHCGLKEWFRAYPKYVQPNGELPRTAEYTLYSIYFPVWFLFLYMISIYEKRRKDARDINDPSQR